MLDGTEFGRLFESFQHTAFRLETLDLYDVAEEAEEFAAFLAGEAMPPEWSDNPWVRSMTDLGKTVARVHVLTSPLTDYLRYELSAYPGNITAGETIGIIDRAARPVAGLPEHDFWLFDDTDVYRMHYTTDGKFIGAEHLPAEATPEYIRYQQIAETHAVPLRRVLAAAPALSAERDRAWRGGPERRGRRSRPHASRCVGAGGEAVPRTGQLSSQSSLL